MFAYRCLFCGVTYRTPHPMRSCTICWQTTATGWLCEEESPERTAEQLKPIPSSPGRPSGLRVAA